MRSLVFGLGTGVLILLLCLSGCTAPVPEPPPATTIPTTSPTPQVTIPPGSGQQVLTGVTWYLIAFNDGGSSVAALPGVRVTAAFDAAGTVSGSAGCNQYTASYEGSLGGLAIGAPSSTKMHCGSPAGIMNQETVYLTTLQGASGFTIANDILTITDSNGRAILTFSRNDPDVLIPASLIGTPWYLNSYIDARGAIWSPGPLHIISLQFDEDGNLSGNAGCNSYAGGYAMSGNTLAIGNLVTTLMFCPETGVMDLETTYLEFLPRITRYSISGNELTLSDANGTINMVYDTTPG